MVMPRTPQRSTENGAMSVTSLPRWMKSGLNGHYLLIPDILPSGCRLKPVGCRTFGLEAAGSSITGTSDRLQDRQT